MKQVKKTFILIVLIIIGSCSKDKGSNIAPTISITKSPQGTLNSTSTIINWSATDIDGKINGYYYNLDGNESNTSNNSAVLHDLSEGAHFFSVYAIDNEEAKSNTASVNFNVKLLKSITITNPSKGEIITKGKRISVFWSSQNISDKVKIQLYENGNFRMSKANIDNTGAYSFLTEDFLIDSEQYRIKVLDNNDSDIFSYSEEFSILSEGLTSITVSSPNGSESWYYGNEYEIKWSSYPNSSDRNVVIWLTDDNGFYSYISESEENDGVFIWTIPSNITPSYGYRVFVADQFNFDVLDYSDSPFSIFEKDPNELSITSPLVGDTWSRGSTYKISWTGYKTSYNIKLFKNAVYVGTIISMNSQNGVNEYNWTIPSNLSTGNDYSILVEDIQNNKDISSGNFTIN